MAAKKKSQGSEDINYSRIKAELAGAGVAIKDIRDIMGKLRQRTVLSALEKTRARLQKELARVERKIAKVTGQSAAPAKGKKVRARKRAAVKQVPADDVVKLLQSKKGEALQRARRALDGFIRGATEQDRG